MTADNESIGDQLTGWGKVALLETQGRVSGNPVRSAVGFIDLGDNDGSIVIAAGAEESDWALNLRHDPNCTATIGDQITAYTATELDGAARNRAISALILKYGTPAERLGRGPAFRLNPREAVVGD